MDQQQAVLISAHSVGQLAVLPSASNQLPVAVPLTRLFSL